MAGHKNRSLKSLKAWGIVLTLILGCSIFYTELTWSRSHRFSGEVYVRQMEKFSQEIVPNDWESIYNCGKHGTHNRMRWNKEFFFQAKNYKRDYQSLPPEEKARLKGRYRKWQSLPQERRRMLRHRNVNIFSNGFSNGKSFLRKNEVILGKSLTNGMWCPRMNRKNSVADSTRIEIGPTKSTIF